MNKTDTNLLIAMTGVCKRYGAVVACDEAFISIGVGRVTAIVGANGAGKSTLVNILCGLVNPDAGNILVRGQIRKFHNPREAASFGIGLVAQKPNLVGEMTALENCALALGGVANGKLRARVEKAAKRIGFKVPLDEKVDSLSPAQRQELDVLRLLAGDARVMVLDEPTSMLSPIETRILLDGLKKLAADGKAILYVSHKLSEVMEIADSVYVMSEGCTVAHLAGSEVTTEKLVRLIAGGDLPETNESPKRGEKPGKGLVVENVSTRAGDGKIALDGISFEVRRGRVFGVAGVAGNGQRELAEVLAGITPYSKGKMTFEDELVRATGARFSWVAYVPEDMEADGLVITMPLCENLALGAGGGFPGRRELPSLAAVAIGEFDIRGDPWSPVSALSGGNRMKVLLAREFGKHAPLLVVSSPAAGLDVRAAAEMAAHIREARDGGTSVVLISCDLDELFELSDYIGVLWRGRFAARWPADKTSRDKVLGVMISGAKQQ